MLPRLAASVLLGGLLLTALIATASSGHMAVADDSILRQLTGMDPSNSCCREDTGELCDDSGVPDGHACDGIQSAGVCNATNCNFISPHFQHDECIPRLNANCHFGLDGWCLSYQPGDCHWDSMATNRCKCQDAAGGTPVALNGRAYCDVFPDVTMCTSE
jgi:hypothetical protein